MFYQNNNDYMRDAFYYSQPQSNTYQYNGMNSYVPPSCMSPNSIQNNMPYQPINPYMNNTNVENMYPQVYRIIDPVARRVISNNAYPYYTEDNVNNMVDTVFNIVEGDVSTLSSNEVQVAGDDTVAQSQARNSSSANATNNRQTMQETTKVASTMTVQASNNSNNLLKDLIKIIIIKQLLTKPNCCNNNVSPMSNMTQNFYDPRYMGMI